MKQAGVTVPRNDAAVTLQQDSICVCPKINGWSYITMETLISAALASLEAVSETILLRFIFVSDKLEVIKDSWKTAKSEVTHNSV